MRIILINLLESYVAWLRHKLTTPGFAVRRAADCATKPNVGWLYFVRTDMCISYMYNIPAILVLYHFMIYYDISGICPVCNNNNNLIPYIIL